MLSQNCDESGLANALKMSQVELSQHALVITEKDPNMCTE